MARREYRRLTNAEVRKLADVPGFHPDGDGLGLQVTPALVPSWVYRYQVGTQEHRMGLGPLRDVGLKEARELAAAARQMRRSGHDPLEAKRDTKRAQVTAAAKTMTFRQCAEAYVSSHKAGWRNGKHQQQWPLSLERYAYPHFGNVPVQDIDVGLVMKALQPVWAKRPETATRIRQRIEATLDFAVASGYRSGDNPARWRGHLDKLLPKKSAVRRVVHHAALPYREVPAFLTTELRPRDAMTARLLEFIILTGVRSGEARTARWSEIDMREKVWTIPAERMKAGKEHRVPLSPAALAVLDKMAVTRSSEYVFPGLSGPMATSALPQFLRTIGRTDITTHGFRSAFRDWAAEMTNFPREVAEQALAHVVGNATEAAYRRSDLFQKRRQLMDGWARYCATAPVAAGDKVVAISAGRPA